MRKAKNEIRNVPLHIRSIAVSAAVPCFFVLGFIGWLSGLPPFTCCKRALAGAVLVYIAATLAVKAINSMLMNAIIKNQMNQRKEKHGGGGD